MGRSFMLILDTEDDIRVIARLHSGCLLKNIRRFEVTLHLRIACECYVVLIKRRDHFCHRAHGDCECKNQYSHRGQE